MEGQQRSGIDLLKTAGACILAPIATALCAMVAGGVFSLFYTVMTIMRPEIIGFIGAVIGGVAGMFGARMICDRLLQGYGHQAVFLVYAALVAWGAYLYIFVVPPAWGKLASYAQILIIGYLSYSLFWRADPID